MRPFARRASSAPVIVGHRGAPVTEQENTTASFAAAADAGAEWVELDVRRSASGSPVVHHDPCTSDGQAVRDQDDAALASMGILRLEEVLVQLPGGLGVDVEVKNSPGEPDYDETDDLVGPVASALRRFGDMKMASSFNPTTVTTLATVLPEVPVGLLTAPGFTVAEGVAMAGEVGAHVLCCHVDAPDLAAQAVERAHEAALDVMVWTVDDPERVRRLAAVGVDALCTNDPASARRVLAGTG